MKARTGPGLPGGVTITTVQQNSGLGQPVFNSHLAAVWKLFLQPPALSAPAWKTYRSSHALCSLLALSWTVPAMGIGSEPASHPAAP